MNPEPERCPLCHKVSLEWKWENRSDEEPCSPIRSPECWRVIGKSKNGGPLLRIVDGERCPPT